MRHQWLTSWLFLASWIIFAALALAAGCSQGDGTEVGEPDAGLEDTGAVSQDDGPSSPVVDSAPDAGICVPQTDKELCAASGAECGQVTVTDRCGQQRTPSCGSCGSNKVCGGGGKPNICGCVAETDFAFCARLGKACGPASGIDNCGATRTVASCGNCGQQQCQAGKCGCPPETDAELCARLGRACGDVTATDNCGKQRSVTSCGSCATGNTCSAGVCSCPAESSWAFCARLGAACGTLTGTDLCGNAKSVASCGTCYGYQSCGGGGKPNQCGCTAESDAELCLRLGKSCGQVSAKDNCGTTRTVASCGSCGGTQTCGGGGTPNQCGCASESNSQFCARLGKSCGEVTAADSCGVLRTVPSCGTCNALQSCGGGGVTNVCGCTPESDAQLCSRLKKNCGVPRAVASCGTCGGVESCGGGGVANVCGGYGEPMQQVCGGGFCWENPRPVGTHLRDAKTAPSGSNWVVGDGGTVLRWNGTTWSGWFAVANVQLNAVWPFSDSDVWVAGNGGTILHYDGAQWSTATSSTKADLHGLWGAGDGTLWAVGASGTVLRRPKAGSFAVQTVPSSARLNAVFGTSTDVWAVGQQVILRYNGSGWASTAAPWELLDVWGPSPSDVWAVSSSGIMRFTGASWAQSTSARGHAVFGSSGTDVWTVTYSDDTAANYRFDGLSWSTFALDKGMFGPILYALTGASAQSLLAVGENGALFRYDGKSWWRLDQGVAADRGTQANTSLYELAVFNGSAFVAASFQSSYTCCYEGLLTRQGGSWTQSSMPDSYGRLTGTGPTNLWTVGAKNAYRFDGAAWSAGLPFTSTSLYKTPSIATSSPTDVWVVIADKTIHYDGSSWTSVPNPISATTTVLRSVAAFDATHVWAGGDAGTILLYDGSSWSAKVSGVSSAVNAIHAPGASLAYAAGDFGVIRWNGSSWQPTPRTTATQRVWAESATSYWVLTGSELKRWDGSQLVDLAPWRAGVQFAFSDVRGAGSDIFVAGSDAVILKKQ